MDDNTHEKNKGDSEMKIDNQEQSAIQAQGPNTTVTSHDEGKPEANSGEASPDQIFKITST